MLAAVAGLVLLVLVPVVSWSRREVTREPVSPEPALIAAGCTFQTYPDQGQEHVDSYDAKVSYNSTPPTSGTHYEQPVIWGAYADEVPAVAEVHNLEHGGVIVHYGEEVDAATRGQLRAFYDESANAMLLAPLPSLGDRITLTAWTRLAICRRSTRRRFRPSVAPIAATVPNGSGSATCNRGRNGRTSELISSRL